MQYCGLHLNVHLGKLINMNIPIFNTYIDPISFDKVKEVLETTFISEGKLVKEFENQLEQKLGLKNIVAVNSGTTALHLALVLAGIGEGDEVIIPAQTFVATGLVILQQKAIPIFADIDYHTGNISIESIKNKITAKTKAIIPVHWGGYPCDMDEINELAIANGIVVIEDAAHALGATYKNNKIGNISDYTCFSFQAIKHLTTGDGGAVTCKNSDKFEEGFVRRWFGIDRANANPSILGEREYDIDKLGFKYHLNDYAAALGLSNLVSFNERLEHRLEVANFYYQNLNNIDGISLFENKEDRQSAYWLFGFHVEKRESFIKHLQENGITTSVIHLGIDHNSIFGGKDYQLINQRKFDDTQIHIPIHDAIDLEKARYIVDIIKKGW
jgi:perosamine synthetase